MGGSANDSPSLMSEDGDAADGKVASPHSADGDADGNGSRGCSSRGGGSPPSALADQVLENVLENVLEFLTAKRDRNAASLVCRSWYRVEAMTRRELFVGNCYAVSPRRAAERFRCVRSLVLKGRPRFSDFNLVPPGWGAFVSPWVAAMAPAYPRLERICLKRMTVSNDDLNLIAESFPFFKDLSLICCDGFSTKGLAIIAEKCRFLRSLDLMEDYSVDDEGEVVDWISKFPESTTTLESLVFECVGSPFNFDALELLVTRSPRLWRLQVNHHIKLEQLCRLMARAPRLTHLGTGAFRPGNPGGFSIADLRGSFVTSKSLVSLTGFREIEPEFLLEIFPVCCHLTTLNLSFANLAAEELIPVIRLCRSLRKFWVLDTLGDEGLQAVSESCRDLRELRVFPLESSEFYDCNVTDVGLQAISEGCRKLERILFFCQNMTNAAVMAMSKNCPELLVFRLCIMGRRRPDWVTGQPMDEGFAAIVMNCKKLTRLAVSGLLTDRVFDYIGRYGKRIKTMSLAFSGNTDLSLQYILQGCHNLRKLEIMESPFGDAGLLSGLQSFYSMRFLWMNHCQVTLRGCTDVAKMLPDLVVEVIGDGDPQNDERVERMYMYRSLAGPRKDAPSFVKIL